MIILFCEVFLFLYFATHRSKTLSPSCQRRQAATAKDNSASSASIHARFLIINLVCEASILSVSRHSPLKEFSSSRQRRQAATILQGLVDKPLSLSFPASLLFLRAHASPLKKCFCKPSCALMLDCRANCTDDSSTTEAAKQSHQHEAKD